MKIWNFVTGAFQVNTFVVHLKDKYVFVVDPGGDILTISQFLAAQELEPVAIVCTHGHFDHIFGIQDLRETNGNIPLVAHPEEKCYFGSDALEAHGYDVAALELIDPEETPKNIMLRGIRRYDPKSPRCRRAAAAYAEAYTFLTGETVDPDGV